MNDGVSGNDDYAQPMVNTIRATVAILLFLLNGAVIGQTVQGIVLDSATREPLPYVHIGVVNKNVGVMEPSALTCRRLLLQIHSRSRA